MLDGKALGLTEQNITVRSCSRTPPVHASPLLPALNQPPQARQGVGLRELHEAHGATLWAAARAGGGSCPARAVSETPGMPTRPGRPLRTR